MAYTPHTLVTFGGTLTEQAAGDEIWECGIRGFNNPPSLVPVDPGQLQNLVNDIATRSTGNLADWFSALASHNATSAKLAWVKAVNIAADGKYSSDPAIHEFATPVAGGSGPTMPSFNCVVLSWTTGKAFGRARFGRVYPPNYGAGLGVGACISSAAQEDLVSSAVGLIGTMASTGSEYNFAPYVVSSSGVQNPITGVRVGNVIDVQRRRKYAVPEVYMADSL